MAANPTTTALIIRRDADVYRLAAIVLSALDRASAIGPRIDRIVVYRQRVVVFYILNLSYSIALDLIVHHHLLHRLTRLSGASRIVLRPHSTGCALWFDLNPSMEDSHDT